MSICYLCEKKGADTTEHVVPRCLWFWVSTTPEGTPIPVGGDDGETIVWPE